MTINIHDWSRPLWLLPVLFFNIVSCSSDEAGRSYAGEYKDDDYYYSDGDADADYDNDVVVDGNDNSDENGDYIPPEKEVAVNYIVPQGAGRYVFVADELGDSVVIVDSETLEIRTVRVGSRPFHLVSLNTEDEKTEVAVLNLNSDDVTILKMDKSDNVSTSDISVRPDTNALVPSPNGRFIIAYHNPLYTPVSGAPGTDQEISVIDLTLDREESFSMAVGMRPWKVEYDKNSTRAFVVTEGGINVIDLENLSTATRAVPVSLFESGTYDSKTADIEITPDGSLALGRKADSNILVAASLDGIGKIRKYVLPSVPSDLDIASDGSFGVLVMRDLGSIALFQLPLPEDETVNPFEYVSLEGRTAGAATLSSDGNRILLHTTVSPNGIDRRRITLLDRTGGEWKISSAVLERPIYAVMAVNTEGGEANTAVVMHDPIAVGANEKPFGYSLVTLPDMMTKLQQLSKAPGQLLLTPNGAKGFLLIPESSTVEKMELDSLIVNQISLSSQPTAAGYAAATDKVFIAQNHTAGRMTFVGVDDDSLKTVTGYNLNEAIETNK